MDKKIKDGFDLVDIAFNEGFETFTKLKIATKKLERIMDAIENECGCGGMMGGGRMNKGISMVDNDDTEGEYEDDEYIPDNDVNDISHVPNQDGRSIYMSIRKQLGEWRSLTEDRKEEYKKFFNMMLSKYGVDSPKDLDDEKKKEFFDAVDRGWKAKHETD